MGQIKDKHVGTERLNLFAMLLTIEKTTKYSCIIRKWTKKIIRNSWDPSIRKITLQVVWADCKIWTWTLATDTQIQDAHIFRRSTSVRGPGSSVGIVIGYELDGLGIESRWGRDFPHLSRPALGPTQPPVQWVLGLSRGKERPGRDADPSPLSSAMVMKV